ncbi:MAG: hypothetical protein VX346_29280 [Planctomycetota bacterium]|nr:hypothetical protein [Planctomycetota bacterium]
MRTHMLALSLLLAVYCGLHTTPVVSQETTNHYWKWGWGTYDASPDERNIAVFDWSFIHVGNQVNNIGQMCDDRQLITRINRILELNPDHKFVVLFWPMFSVRHAPPHLSLFDYLYQPKVKQRLNKRIRQQARLITTGIRNPRAIVAMTFLEELPGHITSQPYANNFNNRLHDLEDNGPAIAAELGHPFDRERDRNWWGRRYCDALAEIHAVMKQHMPQAKVFYWQAERYYTRDHVNENIQEHAVLPFHLRDILRDGLCEGIFGYINTPGKLQQQTIAVAEKYNAPYFTQLSQPAYMTISDFTTCYDGARTPHRLNLGSFLFKQDEVGDQRVQAKSVKRYLRLNESELLRTFCYENQVNTSVVANRITPPQILFRCDIATARPGDEVTVTTVIYNQRNASWFGMNADQAALHNLTLDLSKVPTNAELLTTGPKRIPLLKAEQFVSFDWRLRLGRQWQGYQIGTLGASLTHATLAPVVASLNHTTTLGFGRRQAIRHQRDTWLLVPPGGDKVLPLQARLQTISASRNPQLTIGDKVIGYRGTLEQGDELTIGPGRKARLLPGNMLSLRDARVSRNAGEKEQVATSYMAWGSQKYRVTMGERYEISLTGRVADGAQESLTVSYLGKGGNWNNLYSSATLASGRLTRRVSTARVTFSVPPVDGKAVFVQLRVYNQNKRGSIALRDVVLKKAGGIQDVTDRLDGALPNWGSTPFVVQFTDQTRAFAAYWRAHVTFQSH